MVRSVPGEDASPSPLFLPGTGTLAAYISGVGICLLLLYPGGRLLPQPLLLTPGAQAEARYVVRALRVGQPAQPGPFASMRFQPQGLYVPGSITCQDQVTMAHTPACFTPGPCVYPVACRPLLGRRNVPLPHGAVYSPRPVGPCPLEADGGAGCAGASP